MLTHDFYQVEPRIVDTLDEMQLCIYLSEQKGNLKHISLSDNLVRRQLGRIDDKCFDALVLDSYCSDKMKYFSCFINNLTENHTIGLNYYGITLMDKAVLEKLIAYKKHICFTDSIHLKTFKRFCKDAYEKGKWIVHFGV